MSRIRKVAKLPSHLHARKYTGVGDVYEFALIKRTQTPGVDREAVMLYHDAGVQVVHVFAPDGTEWVCRTENLLRGDEIRKGSRLIMAARLDFWTVRTHDAPSLF